MERILINDETKRNYLQLATNVTKLYKAILPDPEAYAFTRICQLIPIIAQKIRNLTLPADISGVMTEVETLLDQSIELFNQKSEAVYQHIYDSYYGEGQSIYTEN